ncbi:ankyrin repeat protein [Colletotrichum asianum]|uniref:Ankyrin repeat protein n=1 Tax=Colletotrichum asianum TaxID=702518 RepID=A0A8H3W608_9PEZI|nr:ankyrin repeat protein [Colletotrichum asianum]
MDLEADVEDIESLQWLAKDCAKLLDDLLLQENAQAEEIIAKEGHWVSRQYGEFNLWCVKVGVHGQGLRSIDVRLKDVPETCAVVRDLLKSLQNDLEKIQQPADSIQHLKKADIETDHSDSGSDDSSLSFDSLSSLDDAESRQGREGVTLEGKQTLMLRKHVEDTERVKVYVEKDGPMFAYQGYKEIAYRRAKAQFPLASDILHQRMADSFARRRIRFDYLREHQKKRAVELSKIETKSTASRQAESAPVGHFPRVSTAKAEEPPKVAERHIEQQPKDQQTIYSATERTKLERPVKRRPGRAKSVVSIALRHPGFPRPPRITSHSFQCPFCRLDFRAVEGEKARWSQHVMQDFEPYFCPVEQCTKPFDLSNNFDGLLHHLQDHVEERFHVDLPEGEHKELDEEEFERFVVQQSHISYENLAVMKKAYRRKGAFVFDSCPFCGGYPDVVEKRFPVPSAPDAQAELRRHIRQHMQDIALFLPPYREDFLDDDEDVQSSVFSRERGATSCLENSDDFQTLCDRHSCDCKDQSKSTTELTWSPEIQDSGSIGELDAADIWVELFPGLPRFDRSGLTKDYCIHDDILYQFLTYQDSDATPVPAQIVSKIVPRRRRKKRSTILDIFNLDDYESLQRDYSHQRCPGTCEWLFETDAFQTWLSKPSQTFSCYGFPGSGKTVLTSAVINHVVDHFSNDATIGIAFLYCDQDRTAPGAGDDAQHLLTNILKQLAERIPSVSSNLEFFYNSQDDSNVPISISQVCRMIESMAEGYSKIFIIVDAIDEIQEGPRGRKAFLSEMVKLQRACGFNIFLTSRPIVDITQKFLFQDSPPFEDIAKGFLSVASKKTNVPQGLGGSTQMDFCASDEDIRKLVEHKMPHLPQEIRQDSVMQERLKSRIIDQVDGMFQLAEAHLDNLERKGDLGVVFNKHRADRITCPELVMKLVRRIQFQGYYRRSLALKAMSLIVNSSRQLKVNELRNALSRDLMKPMQDHWPDVNDILLACAGMLAINDWNSTIYLSHSIAMDFLFELRFSEFHIG